MLCEQFDKLDDLLPAGSTITQLFYVKIREIIEIKYDRRVERGVSIDNKGKTKKTSVLAQ